MEIKVNHTTLVMQTGQLDLHGVDALIHPTNNYLWFSSGIAEEIKRRGGVDVENQTLGLGPIKPGEAVIGKAGRLKCRHIIHAAAWGQDMMTNEGLIRQALGSALALAQAQKLHTVLIPPAGFSVHGFSLVRALEIVFYAVLEHCLQPTPLGKIILLASTHAEIEVLTRIFRSARAADPPKNEDNV